MARTARSKNKFGTNILLRFSYKTLLKISTVQKNVDSSKTIFHFFLLLLFRDIFRYRHEFQMHHHDMFRIFFSTLIFIKHIEIQIIILLFNPMLGLFYLMSLGLVDLTPPVWVNQMIPNHGLRGGGQHLGLIITQNT